MAASDHLNDAQFNPRRDLRSVQNDEDYGAIPHGLPLLSANAPQLHAPDLVPYPKQMGALGRVRLAGAHLRTMNMAPMNASKWGREHGYDGNRLAYGKSHTIVMPGHFTGSITRKELPRSTRNGW